MNQEIANIFYKIADILELKKVKFKTQAYRVAAQSLESSKDVQEIYVKNGKEGLKEIPGIGEALADKIIEYINKEKIKEYEKLKKTIPDSILKMMDIPGVGVKRASLFYENKIKTIEQLKKALVNHKLNKYGIKEKTEENILLAINEMDKSRIPLSQAQKIASSIVSELRKIKQVENIEVAGSIRRKKATIGDIDIVVLTSNPEVVAREFSKMKFVKRVLGIGKEKASIIHKSGLQVDLRFFNKQEYGAGLLYFTGDKGHNIWLRKIAIKKGWKLNEYGLFEEKRRIAGETEKQIYNLLGVKYLNPEKRIGETN